MVKGHVVEDMFGKLKLGKDGLLRIAGLHEGTYRMVIKAPAVYTINIEVIDNELPEEVVATLGYYLNKGRALQLPPDIHPVAIASATQRGNLLEVAVAGGSRDSRGKGVRLHVVATHFVPQESTESFLSREPSAMRALTHVYPKTLYLPSRTLSEEHKYILERATQEALPGNSLPRPSLLLNPWSIGGTVTDVQNARDGTAYDRFGQSSAAPLCILTIPPSFLPSFFTLFPVLALSFLLSL